MREGGREEEKQKELQKERGREGQTGQEREGKGSELSSAAGR